MRPLQTDLSIWKKFNFEKPPVGVKFLFEKPEGIELLDKKLALCEMLPEAHQRKTPFYFTKEQENCFGKAALGMMGRVDRCCCQRPSGIQIGAFSRATG